MNANLSESKTKLIDVNMLMLVIVCVIIYSFSAIVQITSGPKQIPYAQVAEALFSSNIWGNPSVWMDYLFGTSTNLKELSLEEIIIWSYRIPRVLVAIFVGLALSISGAILQAVTRNELASPYILGINAGAGFFVLMTLALLPAFIFLLPLSAAIGGLVAFMMVYSIAWKGGADPVRLVLAGVVVGAIFGSLQTIFFLMINDVAIVKTAIEWTAGSLVGADWPKLQRIVPVTIIATAMAFLVIRQLNVLQLGDSKAQSLGMHVERTRFVLCLIAIILAAASVAAAGLVGFVGLIVPHIVRTIVGADYKRVIFACLFAGPALMAISDVVARLALQPIQIPVGVMTGLFGGFYFLYLMKRQKRVGNV